MSANKRNNVLVITTVLAVGAFILVGRVAYLRINPPRQSVCRVVCGTNVSGIAKAFKVYVNDTEQDMLPANWCDALVKYDYTSWKQFICKQSDAIAGESSYALNKNILDKKFSQLPDDVVFIFETDFGKDPNGRTEPLRNRECYLQCYLQGGFGDGETKVYKNRWNQTGGPEILTTKHHKNKYYGEYCNIAFAGGRVRPVKAADLSRLKWHPDANDK
jgi:hypothetical protein